MSRDSKRTTELEKRRACVVWGALLLLAGSPGFGGEAQTGPAPPTSIVLISIDTLRADHLGCYGYFRDTSPVIDAFAEESIVFELGLTPLSVTLPAHKSLLTGVHPLEHGILANRRGNKLRFARTGLRSFAYFARALGYRTTAFVSATPVSRVTGIHAGFEVFDQPRGRERIASETNAILFRDFERHVERPFFLWVHYFDPHAPYEPPAPYDDLFGTDEGLEAYIAERGIPETAEWRSGAHSTRAAINGYDGEIRYVDHQVGRLFDKLRAAGLWDEIVIVLLSDHGEGLGEHDMAGHGYIHREQLHVPLMVRAPGRSPRRISHPVSLVDVMPTVLGLIGVEGWQQFLEQASGVDVLAADLAPQAILSRQTGSERRSDLRGAAYSWSTGRWKYVHAPAGKDRLFDWDADPLELNDLHGIEPRRARSLEGQMLEQIQFYRERGKSFGEATERPIDADVLEMLRALGYAE